jgi:putative nucleotidyltransferase with HDIG domain
MVEKDFDRATAWILLGKYVKSEKLLRHSITVEAVMRHFAGIYGGDVEEWGIIGLLHDIDFELYPEQHCKKARELLSSGGCPEKYIRACESHGYGIETDIRPETDAEKVLYTVDELTGLIAAAAVIRSSRSLEDLQVSSVKKRWKQKTFAGAIDREVIQQGADMLGLELDKVIYETIEGMKTVAEKIGLAGGN